MDSRLRALRRSIVDVETAARYVAACVQAGENTRERVRIAACLNNEVALLLEPNAKEPLEGDYGSASYEYLNTGLLLLSDEERDEVRYALLGDRYRTMPIGQGLAWDRNNHVDLESYKIELGYQMSFVSAILLKLP